MPASGSERELVSLIFFFASKRNEANRDPFHMRFACSLPIFRFPFFAIYAYFRINFFALCRFINFWLNINCWMWVPIYIYNLFNVYASHLYGQCVEAGCELICSVRPGPVNCTCPVPGLILVIFGQIRFSISLRLGSDFGFHNSDPTEWGVSLLFFIKHPFI
jgi:hypothetical protein